MTVQAAKLASPPSMRRLPEQRSEGGRCRGKTSGIAVTAPGAGKCLISGLLSVVHAARPSAALPCGTRPRRHSPARSCIGQGRQE